MTRGTALLTFTAAALALPAAAADQTPSALADARRAGIVGERFDGYLGYVGRPSEAVRRQVGAVNIKRRSLYVGLGARRGVTPSVAGIATGCELLSRIQVGEVYLLADGVWRRRDPGEAPPAPEQCPRD